MILFACKSLVHLDISANKLTYISSRISHLSNLKELFLRDNNIKSIPEDLSYCTALEHLVLSKNALTAIPPWLYRIRTLRLLDLEQNNIEQISPTLGQLQSLKTLNLAKNKIGVTPLPLVRCLSSTSKFCDINASRAC